MFIIVWLLYSHIVKAFHAEFFSTENLNFTFFFSKFIEISQEILNQNYACLCLFKGIFYAESKYGNEKVNSEKS